MYSVNKIPIFNELENCKNILIAGAGGGFDILSGLPLYFALKNLGKNVFLANFCFSNLLMVKNAAKINEVCWEVTANSDINYILCNKGYFPETHLCRWFLTRKEVLTLSIGSSGSLVLITIFDR